jgi:hypothetical protein
MTSVGSGDSYWKERRVDKFASGIDNRPFAQFAAGHGGRALQRYEPW